jgi:hypothetical protein
LAGLYVFQGNALLGLLNAGELQTGEDLNPEETKTVLGKIPNADFFSVPSLDGAGLTDVLMLPEEE